MGICFSSSAQLTTTPTTTMALAPGTVVGVQAPVVQQGSFSNSGNIYLYDSWANSGVYSGVGILQLSGANQSFNHGGQEVASLFVTGGGTKQITGNVTVTESLLLSQGLVNVPASSAFLVRNSASITGASAASYVLGRMNVSGVGRLYYPIGTATAFAPVELTNVAGNAPVVGFQAFEGHPPATGGLGVQVVSQARYWERALVSGEMTGGRIKLPAINETFLGAMSNASVAASNELGGTYESLGQQGTSGTIENGTVTSFDNALFSFYALARELNEGRLADSIALVKLYSTANGDDWVNNQNWLTTSIDTWQGVSVQAGRVVGVNLASNNLTGRLTSDLRKLSFAASLNFSNNQIGSGVPASIVQLANLQTLNLANNQLEDLPDVSALPGIQLLDVSVNRLQFDDLEPNVNIPNFNYANQASFGQAIDSLQPVHTRFVHNLVVGGAANQYQWFRNTSPVTDATSSAYVINDLTYDNMGDYELRVTNSLVPDLILASNTQRIRATASVLGKITNARGENVGGAIGSALEVRPGKYDTTATYTSGVNGVFFIPAVVLGDYLIYASQNSEVYIPTYYQRSIDWAFADIINLRENATGINLTMENLPGALTPADGDNTLAGTLESDFGNEGGKVLDRQRVRGAGVTVSRPRFRAKDNEDEVEFELVVYVQTDENGEFEITNLADGDYRLNIQYPGIPMDPTSFVDFTLGGGPGVEQNTIKVSALATPEGIVVTKVEETGIYLSYFKNLEVYPNPADKFVTIKYDLLVKGDVVAELTNLDGNSLMSTSIKHKRNNTQLMDVSSLNNGIYILRFHDKLSPGRPIITYRIIVSR